MYKILINVDKIWNTFYILIYLADFKKKILKRDTK